MTAWTCSGSASPVTFIVEGIHTPSDWNVRFCSEYVKYIDPESRSPSLMVPSPGVPGAVCRTATSSSDFGYGRGFSNTLLTTLKTAVLAPMPMASVSRATAVNVGLRRSARRP